MKTRNSKSFINTMAIYAVIIVVVVMVGTIFSYQAAEKEDKQKTTLTNNQLENLYKKSHQGMLFNSTDYSITNYEGDKIIWLPTGSRWIRVCNTTGQSSTFYHAGDFKGVNISSLGPIIRVCYKGKPFYQQKGEHIVNAENDSVAFSLNPKTYPIKFLIAEKTIENNSFAIITESYDFQGEIGGLYVNGNLISRYIMVKGGVPYLPIEVKKIEKDIIVYFESANRAKLYALYNIEKNRLILPIDYESIENSYKTVSKNN